MKSAGEGLDQTIASDQVARYLARYGQVLVTNYRQFALVKRGIGDEPVVLESYSLADSADEFWRLAGRSRAVASEKGEHLQEFFQRVMVYGAPVRRPHDVAWFLASYAREAIARLDDRGPDGLPSLGRVRAALEETLGLKFSGDDGEHFFRSTLVQTLFYGVFSAWVLWSKKQASGSGLDSGERFNWRLASYDMNVPMIRALYEQLTLRSTMDSLGLKEILDRTGELLARVDRQAFFAEFDEQGIVQHFYEPFLEAFDPELRRELGVWYTPLEIVRYMVERVDRTLREELGVEDGLADENVYVLDPATGTGSYLVEVLRRIERTLRERGENALLGSELKKAATRRVFGFEILPAPLVVAHLQLGLMLQDLGAPLAEGEGERVSVYLTNSLTGWDSDEGVRQEALFPELEQEREAAASVKQEKPVLVVLGNPPYNAFAGTSPEEEGDMAGVYKRGLVSDWKVKKFNLDDLYVRFFRVAEKRITEQTGRGVVCYISNFSYLRNASFTVMRERFAREFDRIWIDALNGDSRETGKLTPEGKPDPSVFSTPYNPEGIRVGTAVSLMTRTDQSTTGTLADVRFRNFWGRDKRQELLDSLDNSDYDSRYESANPRTENRYSFRPSDVSVEYLSWPRLTDLCAEAPVNGLMEKRGSALIDIDRDALEQRMRLYHDPSVGWERLEELNTGLTRRAARFDPRTTRNKVMNVHAFETSRLRRYALRPLETRWSYYSEVRPLWNEPRPDLWAQQWPGNSFLMSRVHASKSPEGSPFYFTRCLADDHLLAPDASCFPLRLRHEFMGDNHAEDAESQANLSEAARSYLGELGYPDPDDEWTAGLLWMHALAVGFSPVYLSENEDGIRQDWPRIPLPATRESLETSAGLGREIARLLDTENSVSGVDSGSPREEVSMIGVVATVGDVQLNAEAGDLALSVGWGYKSGTGAIMPGKGKATEREYTEEERTAIESGALALGLTPEEAFNRLGRATFDIYINDKAYWSNVPAEVWRFFIGGYPVIKKWLSYREEEVLGRSLETSEVRWVTAMVRRLSALALLEEQLDENYSAVSASCVTL